MYDDGDATGRTDGAHNGKRMWRLLPSVSTPDTRAVLRPLTAGGVGCALASNSTAPADRQHLESFSLYFPLHRRLRRFKEIQTRSVS